VSSLSGDENEAEDEQWLQAHKKIFRKPTRTRKNRPKKAPSPRPLRVGTTMQTCPHCQQEAPMETFRDTKCLTCQVADYLGPIH